MKKYIITILILIAIVISSVLYAYNTYKKNVQDLKNYNNEFTKYENTEIAGTEIASILNKAVNNNEQNNVNKDEQGMYIENDENSIKIDIYIKDNDTTYSMEKIYNMGVEKFINSFSLETFKITETQYHNKTGKIKYIKLEQQ